MGDGQGGGQGDGQGGGQEPWTAVDLLGVVFKAVLGLMIGTALLNLLGMVAIYVLLWFTGGSLC